MKKFKEVKDVFCVLPFTHLATHPHGGVSTCCESRYYAPNLNLNSDKIDIIRNNDKFEEVRQFMLEGKKHSSCDFCYKREEKGLTSKRILDNKKYGLNSKTFNLFTDKPLISAELRLGNVCNAKCLICGPHSSSKWNEDAHVLGIEKNIIKKEWYKNLNVYNSLIEHSKDLSHIWFNGGEPTLIKEHYYLLEELIKVDRAKHIELEYHTNGTNLPSKLVSLWKHFKFTKVTLSIDDIDDRLYYSRFPTLHKKVCKNIETLIQANIHYDVIPSISLYNVYNIDQIYNFYKKEFAKEIRINFVRYPHKLAICNLPDSIKKELLIKYRNNKLPEKFIEEIKYNFDNGENLGLKEFLEYTLKLDKHRNLSLFDYLPEWQKWRKV